ncbi:WbqC family protein [Massilia sp. IC2-278]|uniref:WbqC family protein n=1 Tax=Massilia sp. IC2-278 TaxID=2887200 RepID=UPI001E5FEE0C|nr:WbqC family protein [Massilia sp. IC2-278]MCC2961427.1 WbqC family protein [Massilia sp. IC2-278]
MRLAIMQPYLFPYLGYFQLAASVDKFVFYDDVNFIKNGWINRNRLYLGGAVRYFTIPLAGASPFLKIRQIAVQPGTAWKKKMLESVRHAYSKAPYFKTANDLLQATLDSGETSIAAIARTSVRMVCAYAGLDTQFVESSAIYGNEQLSGAARVVDICRREKASDYFNPPGGRELYSEDVFAAAGIRLHFVQPRLNAYRQFAAEFQPGLSILDALMFNDARAVRELVQAGRAA